MPDRIGIPTVGKDIRDLTPDDLAGLRRRRPPRRAQQRPDRQPQRGVDGGDQPRGSVRLAELARDAGVAPLPVLVVLHHVRDVGGGRGRRGRRRSTRRRSTRARRSAASARSRSSPTTASRRRSCATAPSTGSRRGCGSTPCSTTSSGARSRPGGSRSSATASRGDRSSTSRTSRGASSPCSRRRVEDVHNQAFNNGADHLNHQVIELAEIAARGRARVRARGARTAERRPAHVQGGLPQVRARCSRTSSPVDAANGRRRSCAATFRSDRPHAEDFTDPASRDSRGSATCSTGQRSTTPALGRGTRRSPA